MNVKIPIRVYHLERYVKKISEWKIPKQDKQLVITFFKDLESGKVTGRVNSDGTCQSYLVYIRSGLQFFNKPISELTAEDMESLNNALSKNLLKKKRLSNGKILETPFEDIGKIKLKNALILLFKYVLKEKSLPLLEVLKIKSRVKHKTVSYLTEQEIEKLYKGCRNSEERFLVAVLFDSGARAEEFHNIRKNDIELPKETGYVKLTLKEEYSKTKGRTISLYWKYSLEAVREYLNERISDGIKDDEVIFKRDYRAARGFLDRLAKRTIGKHVHFHLFRHSSATYYASQLNRQQLCVRYGWKFSSPMPDVYISRKGLQDKELDEKFENVERVKIKEENNELKFKIANMEFRIAEHNNAQLEAQKEWVEFKKGYLKSKEDYLEVVKLAKQLREIAVTQREQIKKLKQLNPPPAV